MSQVVLGFSLLFDALQALTFRKHMEECTDEDCVITKVTGFDPGRVEDEGWVQQVISNLARFFQGEKLTDDESSEGEDEN